jgi:serine/tyrosine/threonine adenylyltransferase
MARAGSPRPVDEGISLCWSRDDLRRYVHVRSYSECSQQAVTTNYVGIMTIVDPPATVDDIDLLRFDNRFTTLLPADPVAENKRRQVVGAAFTRVSPTPVSNPVTLAWSPEVAELLGMSESLCNSSEFAKAFSGNRLPFGADPFAMCYGGHQFGNWAGQLGDGRAIALGEIIDRNGDHQMLQLKGPGPTPYSRTADGRAVLRSSLREFLCSEAMFHLGIATTRALSLVVTGDQVVRDVLYDGHPAAETGAIVCRVAPSFTRFGSFQLPASRGDLELLRALTETTMRTDFPTIWNDSSLESFEQKVVSFFSEVVTRTAKLVLDWMRVGFVHGVLNTDNMSILGLTIDYGPYGWLEGYDSNWTPNTTDAGMKRYRFGAQPSVVGWNLAQLASALVPLVGDTEQLQVALDHFGELYSDGFSTMMAARLGWGTPQDGDRELIAQLFDVLSLVETDYVLFLRQLASVDAGTALQLASSSAPNSETISALMDPLRVAYYTPDSVDGRVVDATTEWLMKWAERVASGGLNDGDRIAQMNALNPRFVLRNWMAQLAIDAAENGDASVLYELLDVLRRPYDEQPGREQWSARRPEWARERVGCSMLSCSS